MSIPFTYNDWKSRLAQMLIERGIKKKKSRKLTKEYDEEFDMGFTPESIADTIVPPPSDQEIV